MVKKPHGSDGSSNGQSDSKKKPKKDYATKEAFDKLIAEFDYEAKLEKEKARTQELLKKREQVRKEHAARIAELQAEIERMKKIIAEKDAAAAAAAVSRPSAAEEAAEEIVPRVRRPIQLNLESPVADKEPLKQSYEVYEVPAVMPSARPKPAAHTNQTGGVSHLKPPRLPRKSSPAALFKPQNDNPSKSDEENNNNIGGVGKKTGETVVDGFSVNEEEAGTVLQFAPAATTPPTEELKTPTQNGTSAKFRRHVRTASAVSRLIQGFEAVAASNNVPPETPTRGGSFRFNRRILLSPIS